MAAEGISKLSGRGGLRRANKNIVYASRNVPLQTINNLKINNLKTVVGVIEILNHFII